MDTKGRPTAADISDIEFPRKVLLAKGIKLGKRGLVEGNWAAGLRLTDKGRAMLEAAAVKP